MRGMFVTGTDTGVGKTLVSCALLRGLAATGLRVAAMKPVASGSAPGPYGLRNDDALALIESTGMSLPYEQVNPYTFEPPIAPHIAAAEAGIRIELPVILKAFDRLCSDADMVVVEGVGGWQVPLAEDLTLPDLARALALPVVMVVGMRLGCLNHALLTARAIHADGLTLAGWVASHVEPEFARAEENCATLRERLPVPLLGEIPYLSEPGTVQVSDFLAPAMRHFC